MSWKEKELNFVLTDGDEIPTEALDELSNGKGDDEDE